MYLIVIIFKYYIVAVMEMVFSHIKKYQSTKAYTLWLGPIRFVIVSKPEDIQVLTTLFLHISKNSCDYIYITE